MLAALAALLAAALPIDSPLGVRTPGTFRELFLDATASDARRAAPSLDVRWTLANDWSVPTALLRGGRIVEVQNDAQEDALTVALRIPWSARSEREPDLLQRLTTMLDFRLLATWPGYTDGFVEGWHHLARFTNFERQFAPRDALRVLLRERGGATLVDARSGRVALGDATVRQQLLLADGGHSFHDAASRWAVAARLDVKLPLGQLSKLGGSGGWDAGAALLGTCELAGWLTAHAGVGASVWSGLPRAFPLRARRWHATTEVSFVAHTGSWAFVLEDRVLSPAFEGGWEVVRPEGASVRNTAQFALARAHNQITGAVRRGGMTLWLSEDFTPGDPGGTGARWFYNSNAPDIALGLAWARDL